VLKADRIVVLEGGRIAASGSHGELMAQSSVYREIFESQLGAGIEGEGLLCRNAAEVPA
jgi:ATP-binding cassette subfamily B protein